MGILNRIAIWSKQPLLTGPYFDAKVTDQTETAALFTAKGKTKYEQAGRDVGLLLIDHTTVLPRIFSQRKRPVLPAKPAVLSNNGYELAMTPRCRIFLTT